MRAVVVVLGVVVFVDVCGECRCRKRPWGSTHSVVVVVGVGDS